MFRVLVLVIAIPMSTQAFAFGEVHDTIDIAQNAATSAHTIEILVKDGIMVKNQIQMLRGLSKSILHVDDVTDKLNALQQMSSSGQSLTYATSDISTQFAKKFGNKGKGKDKNPNYADKINTQMQTILDTTQGTLRTTQKQMQYNKDETQGLDQITKASNDSTGLRGVMQGSTEILDANAAQMQRLAAMQAQKDSQDATIAAARASQEQAAAQEDEYFLGYKMNYGPYKPDSKLSQIPDFGKP